MAEPSFTPTFHHTDWVDNVDRVQAGGPNGLNVRLNAIEADLHQVSIVVGQIDAALDQHRTGTTPRQQRVNVPTSLVTRAGGGVAPEAGPSRIVTVPPGRQPGCRPWCCASTRCASASRPATTRVSARPSAASWSSVGTPVSRTVTGT